MFPLHSKKNCSQYNEEDNQYAIPQNETCDCTPKTDAKQCIQKVILKSPQMYLK